MTKENKKKVIIVAAIVAAFIVLLSLMRKRGGSAGVMGQSSGSNPNTYYLTSNIPPLDSNGYAAPNFGPVTIGTGSGGGGCNGCDMVSNFGNTSQLTDYLNNSGGNYNQALQDALNAMGVNKDAATQGPISNLPIMAV